MTRFYQFFVDAVSAGVTRKNHIGMPVDQWCTEVATGKAGIWHGGTWHYARYVGQEGLKDFFGTVQFSLIPAGDKGGKANTLTHPIVYLLTKHDDKNELADRRATGQDRVGAAHQRAACDQVGTSGDLQSRNRTSRSTPTIAGRAKPRAVAAARQRHAQQLEFRHLLGRHVEGPRGRLDRCEDPSSRRQRCRDRR